MKTKDEIIDRLDQAAAGDYRELFKQFCRWASLAQLEEFAEFVGLEDEDEDEDEEDSDEA